MVEDSRVLDRRLHSVACLRTAGQTVTSGRRSTTARQLRPPTTWSTSCRRDDVQPYSDPEDRAPDVEVTVGPAGDVPGVDVELAATQRGLAVLAVD